MPTGESEAWIRKYCAETLPVHAARSSLNTLFYRDMRTFEEICASRPECGSIACSR